MPLPGDELAVGIGSGWRTPQSAQSAQSVPNWRSGYSMPRPPPSQQQPSEASAGIPMRVTVLMQRAGVPITARGVLVTARNMPITARPSLTTVPMTARTVLVTARLVPMMARPILTTVPITARGVLVTARGVPMTAQKRPSEPGPPSSQSALKVTHGIEPLFGGRLGAGCPAGGRGGGDGIETRGPKSMQSVPKAHVANLEPGPPLPPAFRQLFVCTMPEECGGGDGDAVRAPQSTQSVPAAHVVGNSELGPPSKHSASKSKKHIVVHMPVPARKGGGLAAGSDSGWPGP